MLPIVADATVPVRAAPALRDAYAIFANAREYWETASYPPQISYSIVVTVARNGIAAAAHYHGYYDSRRDHVAMNGVSDEEVAHPYTPHGINTYLNLFGGSIPLSSPQHTFDYLGVPLLAPNYSFGIAAYLPHSADADSAELVQEIRREFHDPVPARTQTQAAQSGLKTIATIEVVRRSYIITLKGIVPMDDHTDYDLLMQPVRDPGRYRLREVWVDTGTFATDGLITQGTFAAAGFSGVRWTVQFRQIAGAPYIASEIAQSGFVLDRRAYDGATIAFTDFAPKPIPLYTNLWTFATRAGAAPEALTEP